MTRRRLPHAGAVAWSTLALFVVVLSLLVLQLRSGRDPALGRGTPQARSPAPPPRRVVVRKVIVTRVVVHLPPVRSGGTAAVVAAPGRFVAPAPAAPAPVVAPAPVAAPPPAAAPAPLTTRSS